MTNLNDYNEQLFSATYAYIRARRLYLTVRDDAGKDSASAAAADKERQYAAQRCAEILEEAFGPDLGGI